MVSGNMTTGTILLAGAAPVDIASSIAASGRRFLTAQTGEESLAHALNAQPDAVLMDADLPPGGVHLCRRFKSRSETRDIPVILLASAASAHAISEGFSAGAADYIAAPFRIEELLARIAVHAGVGAERKRYRRLERNLHELLARHESDGPSFASGREANSPRSETASLQGTEFDLRLLGGALAESPEAVFVEDGKGRFVYVNDTACWTTGYSRAELLTMCVSDIDPDLPRPMLETFMQGIFSAAPVGVLESRHRSRNGYLFPVEISTSIVDCGGEKFCVSTVRNIGERKALETRLYAREQSFRTLVENLPDAIVRYDAQLRRTYVNPAVASLFGTTCEDLLGKTPLERSAIAVPQQYAETIQQVFSTGLPVPHIDVRYFDRSRQIRWAEAMMVPETDEKGQVASVLTIVRDIHDLKESERKYHTLAENIPDCVARYDRKGRLSYANPALGKFLGLPQDSLVGSNIRECESGHESGGYLDLFDKVLASGEAGEIELTMADDTSSRHHVWMVPEHDDDGRIVGVLAVGRDISALKEAERRLRESYRQQRQLAARSESVREDERVRLAREIHDELGQHLTALRMGISTLRYQSEKADPKLKAQLKGLIVLADKTIRVVRGIALSLRPPLLDKGLANALEWLACDFQTTMGIECHMDIASDMPTLDDNTAVALFRTVQEALTNVARHAGAQTVAVAVSHGEGFCELEIRDDGCGFSPDERKNRTFGLLGMRERTLMLGGELTINSQPGEGTTVRLRVPIAIPKEIS